MSDPSGGKFRSPVPPVVGAVMTAISSIAIASTRDDVARSSTTVALLVAGVIGTLALLVVAGLRVDRSRDRDRDGGPSDPGKPGIEPGPNPGPEPGPRRSDGAAGGRKKSPREQQLPAAPPAGRTGAGSAGPRRRRTPDDLSPSGEGQEGTTSP